MGKWKVFLLVSLMLFLNFSQAQPNNEITEKIFTALFFGDINHVKKAIQSHDFDVNQNDNFGASLLHYAVNHGSVELVKWIMSKKPNLNVQDLLAGRTPLHEAIERQNWPMVKILITGGADVNIKDNFKNTPLHRAVHFRNKNIIQLLIESKALLNEVNHLGYTPLDIATKKKYIEIQEILKKVGAKENYIKWVKEKEKERKRKKRNKNPFHNHSRK